VGKRFGDRAALRSASLAAGPGQVLAVLGPSGAGKTTLLRILGLLLRPDTGEVLFDGRPAQAGDLALRRRIAVVGQKPAVFRTTAFENVVFGLRARGAAEAELEQRGMSAMARLGIVELRDQPARRLSGGEQQRVAFARALVLAPSLLLLDESTANLDPANAAVLEREVRRAAARGACVVAATHDLAMARRVADSVALLLEGTLREVAPAKRFFEAPASPEGRAFLAHEAARGLPAAESL
jgi:tungstate transport system ATP-binding protein